jgi:hypothetical protein
MLNQAETLAPSTATIAVRATKKTRGRPKKTLVA